MLISSVAMRKSLRRARPCVIYWYFGKYAQRIWNRHWKASETIALSDANET